METQILEEIGLTRSEIKVYFALLELGSSSTGKIIDDSGVASSKIYEILDKLMDKGLASYVIKSGVKHFEAASPERLMDYMQERERTFDKQKKKLGQIIPQLEMKKNLAKEKSETLVFKGMKGAETAFEDILNTLKAGDELLINGFSSIHKSFQRFLIKFHRKRARKNIKLRGFFGLELAEMVNEIRKLPHSELHFIQHKQPVAMLTYANKVLFSLANDSIWILVENANFARTFRTNFEQQWNRKVATYEGKERIHNLLMESVNFGDYVVLAEGMKIVELLGEDFFVQWQKEKDKKKVASRGIMGDRYRTLPTVTKSTTKFKFIPGYENPGITLIFSDKVITVVFSETPIAFLVESKELADTNRTYFDLLWHQNARVYQGFDAVTQKFSSMLDYVGKGGAYHVIGATYGKGGERLRAWFTQYHHERVRKGVHAKLLGSRPMREHILRELTTTGDPDMKTSEYRELPAEFANPMQINLYGKDKVLLFLWEDQLQCIEIESKQVHDNFRIYFDALWDQQTRIVRGVHAIESIFNDMLDSGSCDLLGARGYFMDKSPDFINDWEKRAEQCGFVMRNIVDPETRGHRITSFSFAQTKYHLDKEFSALSVIWMFDNKVLMSNWMEDEPIVLVIENKAIYEAYHRQFEAIWNAPVRTYKGVAGAIELFEQWLECAEDVYIIGATGDVFEVMRDYYVHDFTPRRIKQKQNIIALWDESKKHLVDMEQAFFSYKVLPKGFSSPVVTFIYGNHVATIVWADEIFVSVYENASIAQHYKQHFDYLWKNVAE